ncbi:hypothetical protein FQR65_LT10823 [Abscondita terminalis]|nr:hypothetical protein FQR65_LT10823 [Abscondita terminalis]
MFAFTLLLPTLFITSQSTPPNRESGLALERWNVDLGTNPEEVGDYLEGDIIFTNLVKNGLVNENARWPDAVVPYEIVGKFTYNERDLIGKAMEEYHKRSCIRFRPKEKNDVDWISLGSTKTGCWSSVGRVGGKQDLNLQSPGCLGKIGTTIHELLHACGFYHEQNRYDRDAYVEIHWDNIDDGKKGNFKKVGNDTTTVYGVGYDYGSVMHYSKYAFSSNGNPTITPTNASATIGQRDGFSESDLQKLRTMYNCSEDNINPVTNGLINVHQTSNGLGELISILFP